MIASGPTSISDKYFYDVNDELIVDQGNATFDPGGDSYHTEDDYVWLGGRPVLIFRGKLTPGGDRDPDNSTTCTRLGEATSTESVACGAYFPITDYLGKPVAMYDSSQRLTGVGEYEPFGQVNRVSLDKETAHPYSGSQTDFADFVPARVGGLSIDVRTKFQMLDIAHGQVESRCTWSPDDVNIVDKGTLATLQSLTGLHSGTIWSNWLTPSVLGARADLVHNSPTTYGCRVVNRIITCGCSTGSGTGAIVEGYEYRRYQSGATPFWTPLRFPGQYHDEETDLNQNWNRFYEPASGGYLGPDPIYITEPRSVEAFVRAGFEVPTYSYANSNPIRYVDSNGKWIWENPSCYRFAYYRSSGSGTANNGNESQDVSCTCRLRIVDRTRTGVGQDCYAEAWDPRLHYGDSCNDSPAKIGCDAWCKKEAEKAFKQYQQEQTPPSAEPAPNDWDGTWPNSSCALWGIDSPLDEEPEGCGLPFFNGFSQ